MALREPRPDWHTLVVPAVASLLEVRDKLEAEVEGIDRAGYSRQDLDDLDDTLAQAVDLLEAVAAAAQRERNRYGW